MKLSNFGRRVQVKIRTWKKVEAILEKQPFDSIEHGIFHQWGTNVVNKSGQPPVQQTMGIVELQTGERKGKVVRILPEFVTFLDPMKEIPNGDRAELRTQQ